MAMCGFHLRVMIFFLTDQMAIGYIQNLGGLGIHITPGVGHLFIMAGGFTIHFMAGYGFLVIIGQEPGLPGDNVLGIMAGHL